MRKVENQNKEFKQAWNENCFKTICAFANTAEKLWGRSYLRCNNTCGVFNADTFKRAGDTFLF